MNPLKAIASATGRIFASSTTSTTVPGSPTGAGYDAVQSRNRRAQSLGRVISEDFELRQLQRRQLSTTLRDINRNFSIAAWAIRQHLDYVSSFHFRSKTGDKGLDAQIENLMGWYARPENCDPAGRHRLQRLMRMWEMRRVVDGDVLVNRLADGRVQTIEGDRIQTDGGIPFADLKIDNPSESVINGVYINENGRAQGFMVFKRRPNWNGLVWDRMVSARFADLLGYFDRYDQVRGISPLAAAANSLRDVYEGFDYALVKAKVSQMFALSVYRESSDELGDQQPDTTSTETTDDPDEPRYKVDFGRGPFMLDLDEGDRAEILESKNPSTEFQSFTQSMIMVALKSLDIPFSFFDESHTNYSGSRLAGIQYEKSVHTKRGDLRALLDKITTWRMGLFIADGDLVLPKGMKPWDIKWEWSHAGMPWYDPMKEVTGAVAAVNAGFSSPQRECKKLGLDFFEIIDERAEAEAYATAKGVVLSTALPALTADDPATAAEGEAAGPVKKSTGKSQKKATTE